MKGGGGYPPSRPRGGDACMHANRANRHAERTPPLLPPLVERWAAVMSMVGGRAAADNWVGCAPSEDALAWQYNTGAEPTRLDAADFGSKGAPEMHFIPSVGVPRMPRCTQVMK